MTIRVYIDVIPLGDEGKAYPLHEVNIHNIGDLPNGVCEYSFELDDDGVSPETVIHTRSDGIVELVRKVLNTMGNSL